MGGNPCMGWVMGGFQYHVARQFMGRLLRRHIDGKWEYISTAAAREEAGFGAMEKYIWRKQNTVAQFIATQMLLYLCEETERTPGVWVGMRWWEQAGLDMTGARDTAEEAAEVDGDGMER